MGATFVAAGSCTVVLGPIVALLFDADRDDVMATLQLGLSGLGAGLGLLLYGVNYAARTRKTAPRATLLPLLAPDRVGLSLGSRF